MTIPSKHPHINDDAEHQELRVTDAQGYIRYPHVEEPMRSRIERIVNEKPAPRTSYTPTPSAELRNRTQQRFYGFGLHTYSAEQSVSATQHQASTSANAASDFEFEGFEMTEDGVLIRRQR